MNPFDKVSFYSDIYTHYFKYHNIATTNASNPTTNIPKIIHYCWFGSGKFSPTINRCIDSWKRILPEYKIMLWNEHNFDLDKYPFAREAYNKNGYPYVSDVARLQALHDYGGIYLDTDVEILKPLDRFLGHGAFTSYEYECDRLILTALMGAKPNNTWIKLLLSWYEHVEYRKRYSILANTKIISKISSLNYNIKINGKALHFGDDVHIYPAEYFGSTDYDNLLDNAYCYHYAYKKY